MDREKVIKDLDELYRLIYQSNVDGEILGSLHDAVSLLKEQEAKWIHREDLDFKDKLGCHHFHGMCKNCGFIHDFIDDHTGQYKYCPQCGRSVKWE